MTRSGPHLRRSPRKWTPAAADKIAGFSYVLSDDGKFALMQIVARNRSAFATVQSAPGVQAFVRGQAKEADVLAALRKRKKNVDFSQIEVVVH